MFYKPEAFFRIAEKSVLFAHASSLLIYKSAYLATLKIKYIDWLFIII